MLTGEVLQLVRRIEAKDLTTASHTWRVVLYARALAERCGVEADLLRRITYGAALHDIGKVDIPDEILQKPGPLDACERAVMERHPSLGYDRLMRMGERDEVVLGIVRSHHERVDGSGYPDGLAGSAIPPGARYFAVVDTFDAMTSARPYRTPPGEEGVRLAVEELESGAGARYCAEAVEVFLALQRAGELDWIWRHFNGAAEVPAFEGGEACEAYTVRTRTVFRTADPPKQNH